MKDNLNNECIICQSPLEYFNESQMAKCEICGKHEATKALCKNKHYVCNECHSYSIDAIIQICLTENSKNPYEILNKLMHHPFCHIHGPEHHIMVGASLITAYKNAGGNINLVNSLNEIYIRGKSVPGGACGFWGACGAGISTGIFISIISKSTPLSDKPYALSNIMTSKSLMEIGRIGGPRCCKRNSFISILTAIDYITHNFGIILEKSKIHCNFSEKNNQCITNKCPFYK